MKRLYSFGILLAMMLGLSFNASALTVNFEWDIPGSVKIQTGGLSGPFVELAADQTSYTFETSESFGYCYVYATEGYLLVDATSTDGTKTFTPVLPYGKTEKYVGGTMNSSCDGKTFKVNCVKIERNDSFTINVENGLDALTATFGSGYQLDLQQGSNQYAFNPEIDDPLKITLTGVTEAYSITLNDTEVPKNAYYAFYENIDIQPNDVLYIRVYETEPKDCSLTLEYGEGMEGCLYNIRNVTTSTFILPENIENNTITVKEGTKLYINLVEDDFTYSLITLNGEDITSTLSNSRVTITITEETNILRIEGAPTAYANINFTGYIVNPEGVEFSLTYGGEAMTIEEGTAIEEDLTILDTTFPAATTRIVTIPVSEKIGQIFFRPKEGYYITVVAVVNPETQKVEHQSGSASINATYNGTTFYMAVEKLANAYSANINVIGSNFVRLTGNSQYSGNWGNPDAPNYSVPVGESTISFLPGYNTPLTVMMSDAETSAVYLDGAAVTATPNSDAATNDYTFTPYFTDAATEQSLLSTITVYADGTNGNSDLAFASLTENNGVTAEFYYSPIRREANKAGQQVLKGTVLTVKPSTPDCYISYRGEIVHGYKEDGTFVNGLDENGEYSLTATTNNRANVIAVGTQERNVFSVYTFSPFSGAAIKALGAVDIIFPEIEPNATLEVVNNATIGNGTTTYDCTIGYNDSYTDARALSIRPTDDSGNAVTITEQGTWTLTIKAGALTLDGDSNAEITATFSVASDNPTYPLSPLPGTLIDDFSQFTIYFPGATEVEFARVHPVTLEGEGFSVPTWFVDGRENATEFIIQFRQTPYLEGVYTLTIPEGTFTVDGQPSAEVVAHYSFKPDFKLTPTPGSKVENVNELILEYPYAQNVEFIGSTYSFTFSDGGGYAAPGYNCEAVEGAEHPTFRLTLLEGADQPALGTYNFYIFDGAFLIDGVENKPVIVPYTIDHPVSTDWTVSPTETIVYNQYGLYWTFLFDESASVSIVDMAGIKTVYAGKELTANEDYDIWTEGHKLLMGIYEAEALTEGTLTTTIAAGALSISGTENLAIEYTWNVVAPKTYEYVITPSPESPVADLSKITIAFTNAETAEVFNKYSVSLFDNAYTYFATPEIKAVENAEVPTFELIPPTAPTTAGIYNLVIRPEAFTLDGAQEGPDIDVDFDFNPSLSGIDELLSSGSTRVTVVSLEGRILFKDAPAAAVKDLPAGFYIINGKKAVIK